MRQILGIAKTQSRPRSKTPRCRNWLLQCVAHLESEAAYPLRHSRRWVVARSHPLDQIEPSILSSRQSAQPGVPRQVRCGAYVRFQRGSVELLHFSLGLLGRRRSGQCFRDSVAIDLIGEPEIGAVTWLTGSMAVTLWFTASTGGGSDAAGAKVAELCNALSNANPPHRSTHTLVKVFISKHIARLPLCWCAERVHFLFVPALIRAMSV